LNAPNGVELIILAPDGFTEVINETAYSANSDDTDVITLEQSGIYTLTIDPRVDSTVEFAVVVQKQ
jgi:hypothetical protein